MIVHLVDGTYEPRKRLRLTRSSGYAFGMFAARSSSRGLGKKWILVLLVALLLIPAVQVALVRLTLSLPLIRPLGWKARPRLRLRYGPIYVARFDSSSSQNTHPRGSTHPCRTLPSGSIPPAPFINPPLTPPSCISRVRLAQLGAGSMLVMATGHRPAIDCLEIFSYEITSNSRSS